MISLLIAFATTHSPIASTENSLFLPILKSYEFEVVEENNYNSGFFLWCTSKETLFSLQVTLAPRAYVRGTDYVGSADHTLKIFHNTEKDVPLSNEYGYFKGRGSIKTYAIGSKADVRVTIDSPSEKTIRYGHRLTLKEDWDMEQFRELAEVCTRYSFAAFTGTFCVPSHTLVTIGTASVGTRILETKQLLYIKLSDIAKALKTSQLEENTTTLTTILTQSGKPTLTFAAGANAFKKGDIWIDLPDTTILINGELWVPTTVLEHIN